MKQEDFEKAEIFFLEIILYSIWILGVPIAGALLMSLNGKSFIINFVFYIIIFIYEIFMGFKLFKFISKFSKKDVQKSK